MSSSGGRGPRTGSRVMGAERLSPKAVELAHDLLSALFMGLRTAQIHDVSNAAFEAAVQRVHEAAVALHAATGGFDVQFVEDSLFVNGVRLRFEAGAHASMRTLRGILESRELGGFRMRSSPTYDAIHRLLSVFAAGARDAERGPRALEAADIVLLGTQRLADGKGPATVDRGAFALHCYAKLILALRERHALLDPSREDEHRPSIRLERVVQDMVDLSAERADLLLILASNRQGAAPEDLYGAGACAASLALGRALGFERRDLGDLGVAALLHHLAASSPERARAGEPLECTGALWHVLAESGAGRAPFSRAMLIAEQEPLPPEVSSRPPHPLSRALRVASAYCRWITGYGVAGGRRLPPAEAIALIRADRSGWLDQRIVALLAEGLGLPATPAPAETRTHAAEARTAPAIAPPRSASRPPALVAPPLPTTGRRAPVSGRTGLELIPSATPRPSGRTPMPSLSPPRIEPAELIPILEPEPAAPAPEPQAAPRTLPLAPEVTSSERLLGTVLDGKYRIQRELGRGGMGTVFAAIQDPIDRQVAIKVLLSSLVGDEVAMLRFEREARTISRMRHPNTVTIYDFGRTPANEPYIVMELLEGETLGDVLRRDGRVEPWRACRIIRQACASLAEAHREGIVHRDLKPDNIFLTSLGEATDWVKVLDFGLAKLADNDATPRITQQGKVFGTPRYMSPEQANGSPIDHRSDIYGLGVILFEMLTGMAPFSAETILALLLKHISDPPPPFAQIRPDLQIDPRLEHVVREALAKDPLDRPQSVSQLGQMLEALERTSAPEGLIPPWQGATPSPRLEEPPVPRFPPRLTAPPLPQPRPWADDLDLEPSISNPPITPTPAEVGSVLSADLELPQPSVTPPQAGIEALYEAFIKDEEDPGSSQG